MTEHVADPPKPFRGVLTETRGRKRAVNLSLDAELVAEARALGFSLSQIMEEELRRKVRDEKDRRFRAEHRETFEAYNRFMTHHNP